MLQENVQGVNPSSGMQIGVAAYFDREYIYIIDVPCKVVACFQEEAF